MYDYLNSYCYYTQISKKRLKKKIEHSKKHGGRNTAMLELALANSTYVKRPRHKK